MEIKQYKCPNCGGAVGFDSGLQKLKCPFCDAEFEIADQEDYERELAFPSKDQFDWSGKPAASPWENPEEDDLSSGSCPSCGAELVGGRNTAATVCPCCGNAQIVERRLAGLLKPEFVIPFKLDKKAAVAALKNFYSGKRLLPDFFKDENRINSIQGVYLPFWLFDAAAQGHFRYRGAKISMWSDTNYNYRKTDYYSIVRDGTIGFEKIPVDASERMDDSYMDAVEPFDYALIENFETAFLAGYLAEKYDVDAESSKGRAEQRMKVSVETEFARSVTGYSSLVPESSRVAVNGGKISYALFPVWILNTAYKKENYLFIMNGQSGLLVGRLPADTGKAWKYRLMFTGIIGAALTLVIQALRIFL